MKANSFVSLLLCIVVLFAPLAHASLCTNTHGIVKGKVIDNSVLSKLEENVRARLKQDGVLDEDIDKVVEQIFDEEFKGMYSPFVADVIDEDITAEILAEDEQTTGVVGQNPVLQDDYPIFGVGDDFVARDQGEVSFTGTLEAKVDEMLSKENWDYDEWSLLFDEYNSLKSNMPQTGESQEDLDRIFQKLSQISPEISLDILVESGLEQRVFEVERFLDFSGKGSSQRALLRLSLVDEEKKIREEIMQKAQDDVDDIMQTDREDKEALAESVMRRARKQAEDEVNNLREKVRSYEIMSGYSILTDKENNKRYVAKLSYSGEVGDLTGLSGSNFDGADKTSVFSSDLFGEIGSLLGMDETVFPEVLRVPYQGSYLVLTEFVDGLKGLERGVFDRAFAVSDNKLVIDLSRARRLDDFFSSQDDSVKGDMRKASVLNALLEVTDTEPFVTEDGKVVLGVDAEMSLMTLDRLGSLTAKPILRESRIEYPLMDHASSFEEAKMLYSRHYEQTVEQLQDFVNSKEGEDQIRRKAVDSGLDPDKTYDLIFERALQLESMVMDMLMHRTLVYDQDSDQWVAPSDIGIEVEEIDEGIESLLNIEESQSSVLDIKGEVVSQAEGYPDSDDMPVSDSVEVQGQQTDAGLSSEQRRNLRDDGVIGEVDSSQDNVEDDLMLDEVKKAQQLLEGDEWGEGALLGEVRQIQLVQLGYKPLYIDYNSNVGGVMDLAVPQRGLFYIRAGGHDILYNEEQVKQIINLDREHYSEFFEQAGLSMDSELTSDNIKDMLRVIFEGDGINKAGKLMGYPSESSGEVSVEFKLETDDVFDDDYIYGFSATSESDYESVARKTLEGLRKIDSMLMADEEVVGIITEDGVEREIDLMEDISEGIDIEEIVSEYDVQVRDRDNSYQRYAETHAHLSASYSPEIFLKYAAVEGYTDFLRNRQLNEIADIIDNDDPINEKVSSLEQIIVMDEKVSRDMDSFDDFENKAGMVGTLMRYLMENKPDDFKEFVHDILKEYENSGVSYVEFGIIVNSNNEDDILNRIMPILEAFDDFDGRITPRLIVSFAKNTKSNGKMSSTSKRSMRNLISIIENERIPSKLQGYIAGVDMSGNEMGFDITSEVEDEFFKRFADFNRDSSDKKLGITYHVGEVYETPLIGLSNVLIATENNPDRLAHLIVMGEDLDAAIEISVASRIKELLTILSLDERGYLDLTEEELSNVRSELSELEKREDLDGVIEKTDLRIEKIIRDKIYNNLKDKGILVEINPSSNDKIGKVSNMAHALNLIENGVIVTISTDDRLIFGTTLSDEYRLFAESYARRNPIRIGESVSDFESRMKNAMDILLILGQESRLGEDNGEVGFLSKDNLIDINELVAILRAC